MISGAYAPLGTGVGATSVDGSLRLGATLGSTSAMTSSDLRIPLPIAVLRPVVRLSTAVSSASWSLVGGWITSAKPANATMLISRLDVWLWMNESAAASAASRRLGAISVEHMLRETSRARTMVVWPVGAATTAT